MKTPILKTVFFAALMFGSSLGFAPSESAAAATQDLTFNLKLRNEIFLTTRKISPYLYDQKIRTRLNGWLNHYKIAPYVVDCQFHMRAFFRNENVIGPLCYFLRQDDQSKRQLYFSFVKRYVIEVQAALIELAGDPRYSSEDRTKAAGWAGMFTGVNDTQLKACFQPAMRVSYPSDFSLPFTPFSQIARCFHQFPKIGNVPFFAVNIAKEFPHHPGHAISATGWVPGNKSSYFYWNETSDAHRVSLDGIHGQMKQLYPLDGAGSLEAMKRRSVDEVFTEEEGFPDIDNNPIWTSTKEGAIFPAMKSAIDSAQKSIFIDIFFLGSSMGASMAKHLVKRAETGVKVFILRDNYNHFGHEPEMRPVFNFLQAYSYNNPDKMVVSGSYIKAHTSGLPSFLAPVVSDKFLVASGLAGHMSLYGRAQSDHSKVIVIDGRSTNPKALVGSKNLTDASGAITNDEVAQVEGPIAAVVLDDYYWDMEFALMKEADEELVERWAKEGWSRSDYRPGQSREEMVANILKPFDLLGRDKDGRVSQSASVQVETVGTAIIRTGLNNVDSSRTSCVDEVIQAILHAKEKIFIKDQYLFDRNVILALIRAKKSRPSLDIRAILEPLDRANPRGLPNLLYLDMLNTAGIKVRWKKLVHADGHVHPEYHMKTISVDGKSLITGSANKDQTTMYGAFREEQLDIWDPATTKIHDDTFLAHWTDSESRAFTAFDFEVPGGLKGFNGQPLEPKEFVSLLRNIVSLLFDAQQI